MARVTVEDCILNVPNRFELVELAAQRAKDISAGAPLTVDRDNDKDAVVSLREIADKTVELDALREEVIASYQRQQMYDKVAGFIRAPQSGMAGEAGEEVAGQQKVVNEDEAEESGISFAGDNIEIED